MTEATDRQLELLEWMRSYQRDNEMPPTVREIAAQFGIASTNAVIDHLKAMAKKGLVTHRRMFARGWVALQPRPSDEGPASALRPMSEAPTTGPVHDILVATTSRAGCKGWLIAHYAYGGGEDQPPFRGWFYWTGHGFSQIDERTLLGWLPLPELTR